MSSGIDETNKLSHEYHQSVYGQFVNLCRPVLATGINGVYYVYMKSNGQYLLLTTLASLAKYQFFNVKNAGNFFTHKVETTGQRGKNVWVGGDVRRFSPTKDSLVHVCWEHNLWNFCVHYDLVNAHALHGWGFSLGREFDDPASFFLDNMPLLDDFRSYLTMAGKDLIDTGDQRKLAAFEQMFKFSQRTPEDDLIKKATSFLVNSLLGHRGVSLERPLTKRQSECLYYLSLCYSAKEIARNMGLSPRTVNDHLKALKKKLGCSSKTELLGHARRSDLLDWPSERIGGNPDTP